MTNPSVNCLLTPIKVPQKVSFAIWAKSLISHNSVAGCVRELFKPSEDVESLVVLIVLKLESFGILFLSMTS